MDLIQDTIRDLKSLSPSQIAKVHALVASLKRCEQTESAKTENRKAYLKSQRAFSSYKGSLAADVLLMREDRI